MNALHRRPSRFPSLVAFTLNASRLRSVSGAWLVIGVVATMGCLSAFVVPGCFRSSDKTPAQISADSSAAAQTKADYRAKWQDFKKTVQEDIALNERRIDTLRQHAAKASTKAKKNLNESIDAIEVKNKALDKKLAAYEDKGETAWESFEREFSHDMNELGKALKDITVDNVK